MVLIPQLFLLDSNVIIWRANGDSRVSCFFDFLFSEEYIYFLDIQRKKNVILQSKDEDLKYLSNASYLK